MEKKVVGLIPNAQKEKALEISERLFHILTNHDFDVYLTLEGAELLGRQELGVSVDKMSEQVSILIVLGGDGTILKVARDFTFYDIPILGVNLGKMGFLAEIEANEITSSLHNIINNNYDCSERMMLEANIIRDGNIVCTFYALNDVVVTKGPFSRIIEVEAKIDGNYLETYPGDGLIVATPTGSTGYSLSAGGPIINSDLNVIMLTPICPHLMHNRSVVISPEEQVNVRIKANYSVVVLTVDGQQGFTLQDGDEINLKKSVYTTKLMKIKRRSFYQLLHHKLVEGK